MFYFIEERKTASLVVVIRESTNNRKINQKFKIMIINGIKKFFEGFCTTTKKIFLVCFYDNFVLVCLEIILLHIDSDHGFGSRLKIYHSPMFHYFK